jgi:ribosome biogenesis ATPase
MVDSALLRPGRLDKLLYVPLPDPAGRASILDTLVRRVPLAGDVDVPSIGMSQHCEGFSGADLGALVREACIAALQEQIDESVKMEKAPPPGGVKINHPFVRAHHFEAAFSRVVPSVSSKDQLRYKELHKKIRPDGHINKTEQM